MGIVTYATISGELMTALVEEVMSMHGVRIAPQLDQDYVAGRYRTASELVT